MPIFRIHHSTTYRHGSAAMTSWQLLRLQPRDERNQALLSFELQVSGKPELTRRTDYFGNAVHAFTRHDAAEELVIIASSRVRRERRSRPDNERSPTVTESQRGANKAIEGHDFELEQYRQASPTVPLLPEAGRLADELELDLDLPVLLWLEKIGQSFASRFVFDPTATTVSTPLSVVLQQRRGVCQDFSHLLISCLRQHGLPVAYVSGYLLTKPPEGKPRLRGVDAMHAWVSVWVPEIGWIDYDPTNQCFVETDHVVVARGRDYSDVSPIRGIFRGGPRHALTLGVTVEDEAEQQT